MKKEDQPFFKLVDAPEQRTSETMMINTAHAAPKRVDELTEEQKRRMEENMRLA